MFGEMFQVIILITILNMLYIINTILGVLINTKNSKFNWKKFNRGILKVFLFCICIIAYYITLELFYKYILSINIIVSNDLVSIAEFIGILITAYKKYAIDCYKKIKVILKIEDVI